MLKKNEHKRSKSPVHRCLSPCPGYVYNIYRICFKLLCSDIHTFTYWIFTHLPPQTYQWWFSVTWCDLTSPSRYLGLSSGCHCCSCLSIWITAVSWYVCTQPQLRTCRSVYVRAITLLVFSVYYKVCSPRLAIQFVTSVTSKTISLRIWCGYLTETGCMWAIVN